MFDRSLRLILVVLNLFLATNAIVGAIWVIPALPVEWLLGTPFSTYLVPALSLAIVVGGAALISAAALLQRRWWAPVASMITGMTIVIFEVVETTTMSLSVWLHVVGLESGPIVSRLPLNADGTIPFAMWLQPFFFAFGLVLIVLAGALWLHHERSIIGAHPRSIAA
jgi:hypothetical protein